MNLAIFVTSAFLHDQKISKIPLNLTTFRQKPSYYVACVMCSVCQITILVFSFLLQVKNIATEAHKENTAIVITANVNMDTGPQAMDTATD